MFVATEKHKKCESWATWSLFSNYFCFKITFCGTCSVKPLGVCCFPQAALSWAFPFLSFPLKLSFQWSNWTNSVLWASYASHSCSSWDQDLFYNSQIAPHPRIHCCGWFWCQNLLTMNFILIFPSSWCWQSEDLMLWWERAGGSLSSAALCPSPVVWDLQVFLLCHGSDGISALVLCIRILLFCI